MADFVEGESKDRGVTLGAHLLVGWKWLWNRAPGGEGRLKPVSIYLCRVHGSRVEIATECEDRGEAEMCVFFVFLI